MKLLVVFASLLLVCSCAHKPPEVTVCVSDPPMGFQCSTPDGREYTLVYTDSANYVALSPEDTEKLVEWAKRRLEKCD